MTANPAFCAQRTRTEHAQFVATYRQTVRVLPVVTVTHAGGVRDARVTAIGDQSTRCLPSARRGSFHGLPACKAAGRRASGSDW